MCTADTAADACTGSQLASCPTHLGVQQQRAGDGQPLLLPAAERMAALPHLRVVALQNERVYRSGFSNTAFCDHQLEQARSAAHMSGIHTLLGTFIPSQPAHLRQLLHKFIRMSSPGGLRNLLKRGVRLAIAAGQVGGSQALKS